MFCMHTCLERESLLNGFDMCLEPSAEHYLSINGFEWKSPELASLDHAPFSNIQSSYSETCVPGSHGQRLLNYYYCYSNVCDCLLFVIDSQGCPLSI